MSGNHVPVLHCKHLAGASEAVDDLVGYEQDAVPVADVPQHRPILVAWDGGAHGVGHGLGDHGGDGLRAVKLHELLDGVGAADGALRGCLSAPLAAVGIRLRPVDHPRERGLEVGGDASEKQDSAGGPVVGALSADDLVSPPVASPLVVGPGDLQRRLVGLRAAAHGKDPRQVAGADLRDLPG